MQVNKWLWLSGWGLTYFSTLLHSTTCSSRQGSVHILGAHYVNMFLSRTRRLGMKHRLTAEWITLTWPLFRIMKTQQIYKKQFIKWLRSPGLDCTMTLTAGGGLMRMRKWHSRVGTRENQTTITDMRNVLWCKVAHGMIGVAVIYFHFFATMVRIYRNSLFIMWIFWVDDAVNNFLFIFISDQDKCDLLSLAQTERKVPYFIRHTHTKLRLWMAHFCCAFALTVFLLCQRLKWFLG